MQSWGCNREGEMEGDDRPLKGELKDDVFSFLRKNMSVLNLNFTLLFSPLSEKHGKKSADLVECKTDAYLKSYYLGGTMASTSRSFQLVFS